MIEDHKPWYSRWPSSGIGGLHLLATRVTIRVDLGKHEVSAEDLGHFLAFQPFLKTPTPSAPWCPEVQKDLFAATFHMVGVLTTSRRRRCSVDNTFQMVWVLTTQLL